VRHWTFSPARPNRSNRIAFVPSKLPTVTLTISSAGEGRHCTEVVSFQRACGQSMGRSMKRLALGKSSPVRSGSVAALKFRPRDYPRLTSVISIKAEDAHPRAKIEVRNRADILEAIQRLAAYLRTPSRSRGLVLGMYTALTPAADFASCPSFKPCWAHCL
jgi:hypothetical protein